MTNKKPVDIDAIEELYREAQRDWLGNEADEFVAELRKLWPALRDELRELRGEIKSYNGLREVYKMLASENESLRTKLTQVEAERDRLRDALKTATQSAINGWAVGDGERSSPMMQVVRANAAEFLPDWSPDD